MSDAAGPEEIAGPTTPPAAAGPPGLAGRLLEAQVAFHLRALDDDHLAATVTELVEELLDAAGRRTLADLVDADAIRAIVLRALRDVPASAAVGAVVEFATDVVHEGPEAAYPLGDVVDRERVEALVDALLAATPAVERGLDHLADSPLVGVVASRFMGRVVGEVLAANKAVADRLPGLGSLMSLGAGAASKMMGAADKQLEGLLGEGMNSTMSKGGAFAVRRLSKILVETLRDPTTRDALLEVWDQVAAEPVGGLDDHVERSEVDGIVGAVHDLAVDALAGDRVAELASAMVAAFFDRFGAHTPAELLEEFDLGRDDLVADAVRLAPGIVAGLRESGDLERLLRDRLRPFYASSDVRDLLDGA